MDKSIEAVQAMLGRKLKGTEKDIYDICKEDDRYEFKVGANGWLEAHIIKEDIIVE